MKSEGVDVWILHHPGAGRWAKPPPGGPVSEPDTGVRVSDTDRPGGTPDLVLEEGGSGSVAIIYLLWFSFVGYVVAPHWPS